MGVSDFLENIMKVELKNFKHMPSLSEETTCFSASVYFNGEKLFVASNTGKGEGNRIDLVKGKTRVDLEAFRKWVSTQGFKVDCDYYISTLVHDHLVLQDFKRLTKGRVVYFSPKSTSPGLRQFPKRVTPANFGDSGRSILQKHDPGAVVINDLEQDIGLEYYKATESIEALQAVHRKYS